MPSNTTLERALRQTVQTIYDGGDLAELTVKRVRRATEVDLELREGYFKDNSSWKERSKQIIEAEVVRSHSSIRAKLRLYGFRTSSYVVAHC